LPQARLSKVTVQFFNDDLMYLGKEFFIGMALFETYPIIAGQPAQYNFNQTIEIRDGRRTNGASAHMRALVQNVTDQDAL